MATAALQRVRGALALVGALSAASARPPANEASDPHPQADAYYLSSCAACDATLGAHGEAVDTVVEGRGLRFCGRSCLEELERAPADVIARLDARMIADQAPRYPMTTSIVTGAPLPAQPIDFIWGNRLFRVGSPEERDAVTADPARFIAALDDAVIAAQTPAYPMPDKCPVQGDILSSDVPTELVVANRMIRVCCARCVRTVRARPTPYLALIDHAWRESQGAGQGAREQAAGSAPR